jgi:hypothetical protein
VLQALEYLDPDVAFERRRSELLRVPVAHGIPDPCRQPLGKPGGVRTDTGVANDSRWRRGRPIANAALGTGPSEGGLRDPADRVPPTFLPAPSQGDRCPLAGAHERPPGAGPG